MGHLYIHLCTAFFFVIVLSLESVWQRPYHELIELWTLGSLMVGVVALPAGMLGDKLGASRMMVAYFIGMGGCAVAAGLTDSPNALMWCLAGMGVFAAIYHPVGIPWLVRNAGTRRGKVLGFNGIFGTLGTALAGVVAGRGVRIDGNRSGRIFAQRKNQRQHRRCPGRRQYQPQRHVAGFRYPGDHHVFAGAGIPKHSDVAAQADGATTPGTRG